jgi:hypothetical protein
LTRASLTEAGTARLNDFLVETLHTTSFPLPLPGEQEPSFTSRVVRPLVESFVVSMRWPTLVVRGDGGEAAPLLQVMGLSFRPDVSVLEFGKRHIAIEVKFLRPDQDPSGAFAKATGQANIYAQAGYRFSHVLAFDFRTIGSRDLAKMRHMPRIQLHSFKQRRGAFVLFDSSPRPVSSAG